MSTKIVIIREIDVSNVYSISKCKIFELNSPIFFEPQGLMADWGRGFTSPQPLTNQRLSRSKETFN